MPFPAGLWERIHARAARDFPDPVPPKKTITVLGGVEEVDDLAQPDYVEAVRLANARRSNLLGEAVVDLCLQLDLEKWESEIKRIEKYTEPYPTDPDERRMRFLTDYALRTAGDYEAVMTIAVTQMTVTDPEVSERINSFQRQVAQSTGNGTAAPGADEVVRLDVQQPA